ncbi:MAG TPA: serine hydrolase domain-containing protein [Candidatus Baltobacteraceae bacterium]|jgi:D-alanyl-D-alanine carboxypeptidase
MSRGFVECLRVAAALAVTAIAAGRASTALALTPSPSTGAFPPATVSKLDAAIANWFAAFKAPGVVVAITIPGKGSYIVARGKGDPATGKAMSLDDHVRIGSVTKTFTVTLLLQLADKKRLSLDDPVSKYEPFVPNGKNITLRMLANMTSGLFSYTFDKQFVHDLFSDPHRPWTPRQLVDISIKHKPPFLPGKGWQYCNTNTVLLGMILEKVTKHAIGDDFKTMSFAPLGLTNTFWPTGGNMPSPYAHGFSIQPLNKEKVDASLWNPSWGFTAGQIVSNAQDLRTWVKAYTTGAQLSAAIQKQRLTWVTLPPNVPDHKYGLGIGFDHGWLGHTGELPGYNTAAFYLPAQDATMVIEVNSDIPGPNDKDPAPALFRALTTIVTPNNIGG